MQDVPGKQKFYDYCIVNVLHCPFFLAIEVELRHICIAISMLHFVLQAINSSS